MRQQSQSHEHIDIWEYICDKTSDNITNTINLMEELILEVGKISI